MKNRRLLLFIVLLFFLSCSFGCYFANEDKVVINCRVENDMSTDPKGSDGQMYLIRINIKVRNYAKYNSISVNYPENNYYGKISDCILCIVESETEKDIGNVPYEKDIAITFDPSGLSYQQIKESLYNSYVEVELEAANGRNSVEKHSIGKLPENISALK